MQKKTKSHLTEIERERIEELLKNQKSLTFIARDLERSQSTISREILHHRGLVTPARHDYNNCAHRKDCDIHLVCGKDAMCSGKRKCVTCRSVRCVSHCDHFESYVCRKLKRPPYVCNGCLQRGQCHTDKYFYRAKDAHAASMYLLSESRTGIDLTKEEMMQLDDIISPLIKQGQSLSVICANHQDEIGCSITTLYSYIRDGRLSVRNIDMRSVVRYKKRHRKIPKDLQQQKSNARKERTYVDFLSYESSNDVSVVEMDTVVGCRGSQKVVLTMYFRNSRFLLIFLLEQHTQIEVLRVFDFLDETLGHDIFEKTFPLILTDNGSEFLCPEKLEKRIDGTTRTKIFYCDPNSPGQKGGIENVHELIRYCVPKGKDFDNFDQDSITNMTNHINSYGRKSLGYACPFDIAQLQLDANLFKVLNLKRIPNDDVLLNHNVLH